MNRIHEQQDIASEILEKLQLIDPLCFVGGGAPRDWWLEREAADLDFYVYFRPDLDEHYRLEALKKLNFQGFQKRAPESTTYKHPYMLSLYDGTYEKFDIDIIFLTNPDPIQVIEKFPFTICQISWNGLFVPTEAFKIAVKHKLLMKGPQSALIDREPSYIEKLQRKFPDYLLIE